jgi:hypothetical protein
MADRRQIEAMIRKKEQEIQELDGKIKEARIYLQALQDVLKRFPRASDEVASPDSALRPGSLVAQAREAILKRAKPLHVDEMLADIGKEPTRQNKTALGSSISAYVRKGIIFTRTAPNTFGLVELEKRTERQPEPPADFGIEKAPEQADEEIPF